MTPVKRLFLSALWCVGLIAMEKEPVRSPWFVQRATDIKGSVEAVANCDDTLVCCENTGQGPRFYAYELHDSGYFKYELVIGRGGTMRFSPDGFYCAIYHPDRSEIGLYSSSGTYFRKIFTGAHFDDYLFLTDTVIVGLNHEKLYEHDINGKDQSFSPRFHRQKPECFKTNEGQLPAILRVDDATMVCVDGTWGKGDVASLSILKRERDAWRQGGKIPIDDDARLNARLIAARNGLILMSRCNNTEMVLYQVDGDTAAPLKTVTTSGPNTYFIDGDIMNTELGCVLLERNLFASNKAVRSIWYFCSDGAEYTHAVGADARSIICLRSRAHAALIPSRYGAQSIELFGEEHTYHDTRKTRNQVLALIRGLFKAKTRLTLNQVINKAVFQAVLKYNEKKGMVYAEDFPAA